MKTCTKCGLCKDDDLFEKGRRQCKQCRKEYKSINDKKYYENNKEYIKAKNNDYYHDNIDKIKLSRKEHYEKNKLSILAKNKEKAVLYKDKKLEYNHKWYMKYREDILNKRKEYVKAWHKDNKYKANAPKKVSRYLLNKGITIKDECCLCGKNNCEKHHIDYNIRNEIVMLCKSCHSKANMNVEGYTASSLKKYVIDIMTI